MSVQPCAPRATRRARLILTLVYACMLLCTLRTACVYAYQWMDGAWNAQVAVTFARTGRYAVTYPSEEVFCVPITTGQTVLLPAAFAFRLGGVTDLTAAIVPVLYMCAALAALLAVVYRFFRDTNASPVHGAVLGGASALLCFFFFSLYGRYAYQLLGEGAAMLFLLLACLFLSRYDRCRACRDALACGAMLACALITKTVAVCFLLVFALLMLLECLITRRYPARLLLWLAAGFTAAFFALESFKFVQLGCDAAAWITWWKRTIYYSFNLSAGKSASLSFAGRLAANLRDAAALFTNGSVNALAATLLIAPACYLVSAAARLCGRTDPFAAPGRFALLALGLGGDGFLVASLLFTSGGMFLERRVLLHGVCFLAFVVPTLITSILRVLRAPSPRRVCAAALSGLLGLTLLPNAATNAARCVRYASSADGVRCSDIHAYVRAVSDLPRDALYYGYGWSFAAETALLLGLPLTDLQSNSPDFSDGRTHYLLVESYPVEADLSALYSLTPVYQLRAGEETYSVYRLEALS